MRVRELVVRAAPALACAWVVSALAPVAAQTAVDARNVTHVGTASADFDKTGPRRWQRTSWSADAGGGGNARTYSSAAFVEESADASKVVLVRTLPGLKETVTLDLGRQTVGGAVMQQSTGSETSLSGSASTYGAITASWADCKAAAAAQAPADTKCSCDLSALQPLQVAAGLGEVAKKQKDVEQDFAQEWRALHKDPIKIVQGFRGGFYVVDHHHGALAFIKAFEAMQRPAPAYGTCALFAKLPADAGFWLAVQQPVRNQVVARFADENGVPFAKGQLQAKLPPTLKKMNNDPYRTLAWMLRKQDGFCRALMAQSDFAEFQWADWMRSRPELPLDKVRQATDPKLWTNTKKKDREAKQERVLKTAKALALAKNAGADGQPGYNGDAHLSGAACNPKDDG